MKENGLKTALIDYLLELPSTANSVIGSEVSFLFGSRRADIVLATLDTATVYEIKTVSDNTERLSYQIAGYKKFFDYCYVVCEPSNLHSVRKNSPKGVGILVMCNGSISQVRKSYRYKRHDKKILLDMIATNHLKALTRNREIKSKKDLCEHLSKDMSLDEVRSKSREFLYEKLKAKFITFSNDKGKTTNSDDLLLLTRASSERIFI